MKILYIENWTFLMSKKMSKINYTKLLKTKKKKYYGNKHFIGETFCYHNKIFDGFCQVQEIFGSIRWLMDG